MAQNYTRQSAFSDGDTITATLFNDEYNQLVNTFTYSSSDASATGHRHDGSTGEGGNIYRIGDLDFLNKIEADSTNNRWGFWVEVSSIAVEQLRIQDGAIVPVTDNDIDLGTSSLEFKNLYLDGTAKVDALVVDETATITGATTLSSTLAVTGAATLSSDLTVAGNTVLNGNTTIGNAATDTVTITADVSSNIIPSADSTYTLGDSSNYWSAGYIDAITTTGNVSVGGNLTVTGNATISGNLTFGDADTDTVSFSADVSSHILPDVDDTYDLGSSTKEWRNLYVDGTANIDSLVADTADINGGTIDGAIIATSDVTVGAGKTLDVSAGTLTLADNQISGDKVEGGTIAATTITSLASTTVDTTNIEVTNLKAKDGTAAGSIADTTGVVTLASSVLTTTDINGGTIDGATIGATTPAAGTFTTGDFNTSLNVDGTVTADGLTVNSGGTSSNMTIRNSGTSFLSLYSDTNGVTILDVDANNTGAAPRFQIDVGDTQAFRITEGNDISFYEDTGTTAQLVWDASADALTFGDSVKATFGAGSDLQIYHDGSNSRIYNSTGSLLIRNDDAYIQSADGTASAARFNATTGVTLYRAGAVKLETTSTGIDVTGTVTADGLTVDNSGDIRLGFSYTRVADADNAGGFASGYNAYVDGATVKHDSTGTLSAIHYNSTGVNVLTDESAVAGTAAKKRALFASNGDISFYEDTGTTPKFFWDASAESLGIGTTTTAISSKLQVASTTTALDSGGTIFASTTDSPAANIGGQVMMGGYYTGTSVAAFGGMAAKKSNATDGNYDGYLQFLTSTHPTGNTEKMRIDASGNVGIGTTSPGAKLTSTGVTGTTLIQALGADSDGFADVEIKSTGTSGASRLYFSDTAAQSGLIRYGHGTNSMEFTTSGSERMRIDSAGNVGIGTSSPGAKLAVVGTTKIGEGVASNTSKLMVNTTSGTAAGIQLFQDSVESWIIQNPASSTALTFANSGTERMRLDASGNLLVGTTGTSSTVAGTVIYGGSLAGVITHTYAGRPLYINRLSSDGDIIEFAKDGATVGSIGSYSGTDTYITGGSGNSTGVVITANAIVPSGAAGATNANIDLGLSATGRKFKDLYLTGGLPGTAAGSLVINENGVDSDFRVESDTNTHMLFVNAGLNAVGVGISTPSYTFDVAGPARVKDVFFVESTGGANLTQGHIMISSSTVDSPAARGQGVFMFNEGADRTWYSGTGYNAGGDFHIGFADSASATTEGSRTTNSVFSLFSGANGAVFNDNSADRDFRVESDSNTHMLFVDGGNNSVNINSSAVNGAYALKVVGTATSGSRTGWFGGPDVNTSTATSAPVLTIENTSATTGNMTLLGFNNSNAVALGSLGYKNEDTANGYGTFYLASRGATHGWADKLRIYDTSAVWNEDGLDIDFRVESDNYTHAFFVQGSNGRVNIGDATVPAAALYISTDANLTEPLGINDSGASGATQKHRISFKYQTTEVGSVKSNNSATTFNTSSDARLKENIADADDAGELIDAIQVRQFNWIVDGAHQRYGMVAQELITVAPEAVSEGETEEEMMGVDYSKLVPMLIKEIQSLRARVHALESK